MRTGSPWAHMTDVKGSGEAVENIRLLQHCSAWLVWWWVSDGLQKHIHGGTQTILSHRPWEITTLWIICSILVGGIWSTRISAPFFRRLLLGQAPHTWMLKHQTLDMKKNSLPPLTKTVCSLWIVSPFIAAVQCVNLWLTSLNFTNIQSFNDLAAGRLRSYNNYLLNSEIFPVATKSFACHPATVRREQWLHITYRSELDVYGVIERDLLLQILKLLHVLTAAGLHHILKVKHARLSAVQNNHGAEFRESGGRKANNQTVRLWSVGWQSCK